MDRRLPHATPLLPGALLVGYCCLLAMAPQSPVQACLNDRDTLAEEARILADEAKGLPGVIQTITGRFPRNPALFYEMRLKRVAEELKRQPARLELYDDAGVACDRVGRDDEALLWMRKKLTYLQRANASEPAIREHWYRYYANYGTFLAHRWIRAGANRSQIREMQQARDSIKKAIEIKPDAHFGREKYQLKAMEWIIKPGRNAGTGRLDDFLHLNQIVDQQDGPEQLKKMGYSDAVRGLSGLITLGNAWQSLDVFYELKLVLMMENKATLVTLANLRLQELMNQGLHSIHPAAPVGDALKQQVAMQSYESMGWYPSGDRPEQLERFYRLARTEADDYQQRRTDFMMARLKAGRHPDTDPTFWNGYHDAGPPDPAIIRSWWFNNPWAAPLLRSFAIMAVASLLLLWTMRTKRRQPRMA